MTDALYVAESRATGRIKIGRSQHPQSRMLDVRFQAYAPDVQLIAVVPNKGHRESLALEMWKRYRIEGEWFSWQQCIVDWARDGCHTASPIEPGMTCLSFGKRVKALRKAAGLTQEQCSEAAGMRQGTWSKFERGTGKKPTLGVVQKIAKALEVSQNELVGTAGNKK